MAYLAASEHICKKKSSKEIIPMASVEDQKGIELRIRDVVINSMEDKKVQI